MIRSMTGFGRAEASDGTCVITVEARSVNHRHLDIALRLPAVLAALELEVRRLIQARLERGRVDVSAQLAPISGGPAQDVRINAALARQYHDEARSLAGSLGLDDQGLLRWLLERPGVVELRETAAPDPERLWSLLARGVGEALDALLARRAGEGTALTAELRALLAELGGRLTTMAARAPLTAARRGERLRERLRALLGVSDVSIVGQPGENVAGGASGWLQRMGLRDPADTLVIVLLVLLLAEMLLAARRKPRPT